MSRCVAILAAGLAVLGVPAITSPAAAEAAHQPPQGPAKVAFGPGFRQLVDHQWSFPLGGWGGVVPGGPRAHHPVIFVHGNNVDAADWYPVRDDFLAAGWTVQELYALSYNGLGANNGSALLRSNPERDAEHRDMGWDGMARITSNDVNVADLHDFVLAVRSYTGSDRFSLVGHSLGVTLARKTLKVHPELRPDLVAFVGIAGANDGTSFCPPGSEGNVVSCDEIAAGTPWLAELNGTDGSDETYPPARWMTVYDGTGAGDPAFAGPTYAQSPALKGAHNHEYPGTYHNDLRLDPDIVRDYRIFIEKADAAARATSPDDSGSVPSGQVGDGSSASSAAGSPGTAPPAELPATGGRRALPFAVALLAAGLLLQLVRARLAPARSTVACTSPGPHTRGRR